MVTKTYTKACPNCGSLQSYGRKGHLEDAIKGNWKCRSCSNHDNNFKGKYHSIPYTWFSMKQQGMKEKDGRMVPNCVPVSKSNKIDKAKKPDYDEFIKPRRGGSEPSNARLYARIIQEAKDKFDVYPSAVANSWVVQEYKRRGGTYKSEKEITKTIWDGGLLDPKNFTK